MALEHGPVSTGLHDRTGGLLSERERHESIETTLKFYVGRNAEKTAETLYEAVSGNTLGNTTPKSPSAQEQAPPETVFPTGFAK